ncbi:MAG: TRAP transporter small permease subunit [Alphaproteobacteria bacterium]|nr:TRAP transporter small permease subunit [Alphaproteobacteria bacterium]
MALGLLFVFNSYLIFWRDWPGVLELFGQFGWFGLEPPRTALSDSATTLGWIQLLIYLVPLIGIVAYVIWTRARTLHEESEIMSAFAAYIVRAAFWSVLLVGLADMMISFLRVEGLLPAVVGETLAKDLGRSSFRGSTVHYPLIGLSLLIAFFTRSLGFTWLALLIVVAELQIVIARFIFSYEQAFMADLVRFWYAALFLFASAYTLVHEGHVRVDILYTGFSERGKAWTNSIGSVILGVSLCWVILIMGMWNPTNVITGPLLNFEVTQAGFGLYVKYFMAGFLLVYALSMLVQFTSYFLSSVAVLIHEPGAHVEAEHFAEV